MENNQSSFQKYLLMISSIFVKQAGRKFLELARGWVLQTGAKTTTGLIRTLGESAEKTFSSYHRFFNTRSWHPKTLWKKIAEVVLSLSGEQVILAADDTTVQKVGREITGTGWYPGKKDIYHKEKTYVWGLNWVVVGVILPSPFGIDKVFCLPIYGRLYRPEEECEKQEIQFRTRLEILSEMIRNLAEWFPERNFTVLADSMYGGKPMLEEVPENVEVIVRGKPNYVYHNVPPSKREPGRRGPDRKKGKRIGKASRIKKGEEGFQKKEVNYYGDKKTVLVRTEVCLWYHTRGQKPIRLVIVKNPEKDSWASFICTDPELEATEVIETYCYRWAIEVVFRDGKQFGGVEDPQCRTEDAVKRQTSFNLGMMSLMQVWYLKEGRGKYELRQQKWEGDEKTYSFQKILRRLRWEVRRNQIKEKWGIDPTSEQKIQVSWSQLDELIDRWSRVA